MFVAVEQSWLRRGQVVCSQVYVHFIEYVIRIYVRCSGIVVVTTWPSCLLTSLRTFRLCGFKSSVNHSPTLWCMERMILTKVRLQYWCNKLDQTVQPLSRKIKYGRHIAHTFAYNFETTADRNVILMYTATFWGSRNPIKSLGWTSVVGRIEIQDGGNQEAFQSWVLIEKWSYRGPLQVCQVS